MMRNALIGGLVWIAVATAAAMRWVELEWIDLLFLFAPLVIVPLGLELTRRVDGAEQVSLPLKFARVAQLPSALLVVASFWVQRGALAAGLAAGWLGFSGLLAIAGLTRLWRGGFRSLDAVFAVAAFLYLPVGGAWLVASRLGLTPMGFQEPIVLLTAVHFHYAGFAAPILARSTRLELGPGSPRSIGRVLFNVIAAGVLVGPGLLAAGFVIGPRVKLAAALILAASEIGLAASLFGALTRVRGLAAKSLIGVAASSVMFAMILAALWAIGEYPLQPFVHLQQMARLHGTANAFGFTLCGLLGWTQAAGHAERAARERRP